uniref:Acid phosphatase n=1 Tax=Ananas comosus var. bracteatus TaxID=296719 RepID=A0A6V7QUF7_ANACO
MARDRAPCILALYRCRSCSSTSFGEDHTLFNLALRIVLLERRSRSNFRSYFNLQLGLFYGFYPDMGGHYVMESGVYMSSYAATIFITALLTIGVLLLAVLVALTVMLESCQRTNSGAYKQSVTNDQYDYCKIIAFHAELNNSEEDETPTFCKEIALNYFSQVQFTQDLNLTVHLAESYFSVLKPNEDGLDAILMDIDDLILEEVATNNSSTQQCLLPLLVLTNVRNKQVDELKHSAQLIVFRFLMKLQASGWSLHFFTRKPSWNSDTIIETLKFAGYEKWSSLVMRSDEELQLENWNTSPEEECNCKIKDIELRV